MVDYRQLLGWLLSDSYICHYRVHLLHTKAEDAGQQGFKCLTRLLNHNLHKYTHRMHTVDQVQLIISTHSVE